ncbi:MAG: transcriptional repressor [Conexibacter sp.]
MTRAPERPALPVVDVEDVAAALRRSGSRLSAARRLVLEALFASEEPVSAEQIAAGLGGRSAPCELTSVYRTLERLEALGVVRHLHVGHGPGRYLLEREGSREYLACERCGAVRAVAPAELDAVRAQIGELTGYAVRFDHFPLHGLCERCARS